MLNTCDKNQDENPLPATNKAEALLRKYFTQITRGCGDPGCSNPSCFSNPNRSSTIDQRDSNAAAGLALSLLRVRAPLCPLLTGTDQISSPVNQSESGSICASGDVSVTSSKGKADETDTQAMECDTESGRAVLEPECLTEKRLLAIISDCEAKDDYSQLRRDLGEVFYSADLLKKSFRTTNSQWKEDAGDDHDSVSKKLTDKSNNRCNNGISLDLAQVRSAFRALFDVPGSPFQQTLIDAIKYLMENAEVELKYRHAYEQDADYLNLFVLILEMPLLHEPEFIQQAFPAFCKAAAQLPIEAQIKLAKLLSTYADSQLLNIVHAIQQSITVRLLSGNYGRHHSVQEDDVVCAATKLLGMLYYAALYGGQRDDEEHLATETDFYAAEDKILQNLLRQEDFPDGDESGGGGNKEILEPRNDPLGKGLRVRSIDCRRPLIPFDEFYNETLSEIIEVDQDFVNFKAEDGRFSFMNFPYVLLPATKMQCMFFDNRIRMYSERRQALVQTLLGAPTNPYLRLRVRRSHLVEDSLTTLEIIAMDSPSELKKQLYVDFEGEQGVDEGGVSKEFYQLITAELFNPDHAMFTYHPESRLYWFNASAGLDSSAEYTLIGTLFGLAIYNNVIVDVQFPMVVYKKLLGKLGVFEDLKDVDATLYSSLKQMLDYDGADFEEVFGCTFRIMSTDCYGGQASHDLKPNGNEVPVTKENVQEFVKLYADYLLNRSIEQQFHAFRRGFGMVCTNESPLNWLFRPDEIEQLVCGSKNFDFTTLERSTDYDSGYSADNQTVKHFWEVIHEMSEDQKRLFLRFVTGSDRIPIGGMSKLKFIIARNGADSEKLPTAHTCFNVLLLPEYASKEKLKERLLKAITYCEGFGLM